MNDKIKPHHLERKAILYVRQSSAYQVQNNLESQRLQYAMRDRLCNLGWSDLEVIDEDIGRPASGTATRASVERMVAEVCLGHVIPQALSTGHGERRIIPYECVRSRPSLSCRTPRPIITRSAA